jgi:hypothetical protein
MCLLGQFESNENTPSRTAIAINPRCVMYRRVAPRHGAAPLGSQDLRLVLGKCKFVAHDRPRGTFSSAGQAPARAALAKPGWQKGVGFSLDFLVSMPARMSGGDDSARHLQLAHDVLVGIRRGRSCAEKERALGG